MACLVFVGALFGGYEDEPSERQMLGAFEGTLALQVRNAVDFVEESAGLAAAEAIRTSGYDRFEILSFQKLHCARASEQQGHVCSFHVDIGVVNGALERTVTGRFVSRGSKLVFTDHADI
jgi:hypothetical protein